MLLHLVPFFIVLLYSLFFSLQPVDFKLNVYISSRGIDLQLKDLHLQYSPDPLAIRNYFGIMLSVQLIAYLFLSCSILLKKLQELKLSLRKPQHPVLIWLRNLLLSTSVMTIVTAFIQIFYPGGKAEFLIAACFTIFIYFLNYNLIRGSLFLSQTLFPDKYLKSTLTDEMKLEYKTLIERLMNDQKIFRDKLFSLKKLSKHTGIPEYLISQILNESFNKSFFELTREYRIEEASRLLKDPANNRINIEEIAGMVGYNSKSAFNKAFLRITGKTPLSFKKENVI